MSFHNLLYLFSGRPSEVYQYAISRMWSTSHRHLCCCYFEVALAIDCSKILLFHVARVGNVEIEDYVQTEIKIIEIDSNFTNR